MYFLEGYKGIFAEISNWKSFVNYLEMICNILCNEKSGKFFNSLHKTTNGVGVTVVSLSTEKMNCYQQCIHSWRRQFHSLRESESALLMKYADDVVRREWDGYKALTHQIVQPIRPILESVMPQLHDRCLAMELRQDNPLKLNSWARAPQQGC